MVLSASFRDVVDGSWFAFSSGLHRAPICLPRGRAELCSPSHFPRGSKARTSEVPQLFAAAGRCIFFRPASLLSELEGVKGFDEGMDVLQLSPSSSNCRSSTASAPSPSIPTSSGLRPRRAEDCVNGREGVKGLLLCLSWLMEGMWWLKEAMLQHYSLQQVRLSPSFHGIWFYFLALLAFFLFFLAGLAAII